ncbi:imidazolonepropionase [Chondrinema litorale]|uniref:imidazolonepropionase n=1 Tax=Chondrinema litorale TaxID=2994555 RepID=UPI002542751E|nr:imidazolonepropionase [Chondrinema litorale]UZR97688.1 imidazolonepropionase [Chondrinema litorale]
MKKLTGPFSQIITLNNLPAKGAIKDEQLEIITDGGILTEGDNILQTGSFDALAKANPDAEITYIDGDFVALPAFTDCHTHICFAGSRAKDYAARNNGKTYQEIAQVGGGIWDTVTKTREASLETLQQNVIVKLDTLLKRGITTVEVKSGYGLSFDDELKMLRAIKQAGEKLPSDVISTCLAAHIVSKDFQNEATYLQFILDELVPIIKAESLTNRFDIFIEQNAFSIEGARFYLNQLKEQGFELTVHGDQFSKGGSKVAVDCGAVSVDHLEVSGEEEIERLAKSDTIPVVLPGASMGLGMPFSPARKLLDAGCGLAIASDWNPGSAPQGNLLNQAALLGTYEKLSAAEVFAGITFRAAKALKLFDRGVLKAGNLADFISFNCNDYREILYHQGELQAEKVWKKGNQII